MLQPPCNTHKHRHTATSPGYPLTRAGRSCYPRRRYRPAATPSRRHRRNPDPPRATGNKTLQAPTSRRPIPLQERIIFALDVSSAEEALRWVARLKEQIGFYKVGLELFLAGGFPLVKAISSQGCRIMLDLKFLDIPETVRRATAQLRGRNIYCTTVHGADPAVLRAAVSGAQGLENSSIKTPQQEVPHILAVTALTSQGGDNATDITTLVRQRAADALQAGCTGIVSSAREAAQLRADLGWDFLLITPGIRPATTQSITREDQVRTTTPAQAIRAGADHLVIGRPIRDAHHPEQLITKLQQEISIALQ